MNRPFLTCLALAFSLQNLSAQDESNDWAFGLTVGISDPIFIEVQTWNNNFNLFYHTDLRGLSISYKSYVLNLYTISPDRKMGDFRHTIITGNIGYQYSLPKLKKNYRFNPVVGAYLGFDQAEIAFGLEDENVRIFLGLQSWILWQTPKWYTEYMHGFNDPNALQTIAVKGVDWLTVNLKIQYKFALRNKVSFDCIKERPYKHWLRNWRG